MGNFPGTQFLSIMAKTTKKSRLTGQQIRLLILTDIMVRPGFDSISKLS